MVPLTEPPSLMTPRNDPSGMVTKEWAAAANIDKLVSADMRVRGHHNPELVLELYDAAREAEGDPLSYAAARTLRDAISPGDYVLITTGAGAAPWLPHGETDGPQGAAAIGRACALGLGAVPVFLTEDRCISPVSASARACGLTILEKNELRERRNVVASLGDRKDWEGNDRFLRRSHDAAAATEIRAFPTAADEGEREAERLLDTYDPGAIIAVEKLGPNSAGIIHSSKGSDMTEDHAAVAALFEQAAETGIPTIGCGDRGNEIGFGKIEETVRRVNPHGDACSEERCGCDEGTACRIETTHLSVGGTSNWAAYGIAAMIAIGTETAEALHGPAAEEQMLEEAVANGAVEGIRGHPAMSVDFTSSETQAGLVRMLNQLVENSLTEIHRPF